MQSKLEEILIQKISHSWLNKVHACILPEHQTPLLQETIRSIEDQFTQHGHNIQTHPDNHTDIILTTAAFGVSLDWRNALLFSARRFYNLDHTPAVYTLIHVSRTQFNNLIYHFRGALAEKPPNPMHFSFRGLASDSPKVLIEQGLRGGAILACERLMQAQSKSINVILVIGDRIPEEAYLFNLVGAYPSIPYVDHKTFFNEIMLHMVTTVSTYEITNHKVLLDPIAQFQWAQSKTVKSMQQASLELGKFNFFTPMLQIADLVSIPALGDTIASQYSEGCFASWDPEIGALIATVTGSARPVDKENIGDDDLAVIVGVRSDGSGALVRPVERNRNDPPSSEAVEMFDMDSALPTITLGKEWDSTAEVPVIRSKLHGHRGVASFDSQYVEHVYLDPAYYHYPVSCATKAQAKAIKTAFGRSEALQDPQDPRCVVFTVIPGHGIMVVEKWITGKKPFQVILECFDEGALELDNRVPQGPLAYVPGDKGRTKLITA